MTDLAGAIRHGIGVGSIVRIADHGEIPAIGIDKSETVSSTRRGDFMRSLAQRCQAAHSSVQAVDCRPV
jgi:hypothetical protein